MQSVTLNHLYYYSTVNNVSVAAWEPKPFEFEPVMLHLNLQASTTMVLSEGLYLFNCPWCEGLIAVGEREVRCGILRHGVVGGRPVPPHHPRAACEALVAAGRVHGCCRPVRMKPRTL